MARLLGFLPILDLEDGSTGQGAFLRRAVDASGRAFFEWLCSRAMLACGALAFKTRLRPVLRYYGTIDEAATFRNWMDPELHVLLGGTIGPDTGASLLAAVIGRLREERPKWGKSLIFQVTGNGPSMPLLESLAKDTRPPRLIVHGRTSDSDYRAILAKAHVGLALKPNDGPLAHTTFPSKVTEMASVGLLVLSTDISDVRALLGDGAYYLERDDASLLIKRLGEIALSRNEAAATAARGTAAVSRICAPAHVGRLLAEFLFPATV
jgi:glycosyltransferase involved in cell wall biosynthesis